eukprot:CAMPEP_0198421938 /NCGR_PEP_ID=MMETSP1452-20131203/1990_1 /TAXON_ID=1181717 /ORGANISM="Synchroma pusillum, Strain CCMP3072" /LENGTH=455 /DNA_ID=CAMNT_0044142183 /DNA_START=62 /DNA_END=1429 /DNA_ORIENTATION=+
MIRATLILGMAAMAAAASRATVEYTVRGEQRTGKLVGDPVADGFCGVEGVQSESGYYSVSAAGADSNYFYWSFDAQVNPETAPLVMWLTGGPGCSSTLALLVENGPCKVTDDAEQTYPNEWSWNRVAKVMWVDQPIGVGFSYGSVRNYARDEDDVGADMYSFLQAYFQANPADLARPFYVVGESYGGHYAPAVTEAIYNGNQNLARGDVTINLAGVGVGNGLTNPTIQYAYYAQMAYNNSYGIQTISESEYEDMVAAIEPCQAKSEACQQDTSKCEEAYNFCNDAMQTAYSRSGLNVYDITKYCEGSLCYNLTMVDTFMDKDSTRAALNVNSKSAKWQECSNLVYAFMESDMMQEQQQRLIPLLESGIPVTIYAGDKDFICNWYGNRAWTEALEWSGKEAFNAAAVNPLMLDDAEVGQIKTSGGFTFVRVYEAGHMVPMDQPAVALYLLDSIIMQ